MTAPHIMLDIEALGLVPGSAITEIAAVAFDPETFRTGEVRHYHIAPAAPLTADLETLEWHRRQATFPHPPGTPVVPIEAALLSLTHFIHDLGTPVRDLTFWSWGSTYDFPLLHHACQAHRQATPWHYWQAQCARTVWRLAFGPRKPPARNHNALEDARAAVADLAKAYSHLTEFTHAAPHN